MITINIIGAGRWGPNIIRCYMDASHVNVKQVVDLDLNRLSQLKDRYPGVEFSNKMDQAVTDPEADAVVVATPVHTHYMIAKKALEAGKHVFVEKPISRTVAEAEELCILADSKGCKLMVGHVFLFNNAIRRVKEYIQSGELGELLYIDAVRTNLGPVRTDVNAFWDLATHDISIVNYWLDENPARISVTGSRSLGQKVEDVNFASLEYPSGVLAHMHASWLNPRKIRQITVVGDKKMLVWDDIDLGRTITLYDSHVERPVLSDSFGSHKMHYHLGDILIPQVQGNEPLKTELLHFVSALRGEEMISDGRMGRNIVCVLEAGDQSLKQGGVYVDTGL